MSDRVDIERAPVEADDFRSSTGAERALSVGDGLMLAVASLAVLCSLGLFALGY